MDIKVGDKLTRLLGGTVPHIGRVTSIDKEANTFMFDTLWQFNLTTGLEIDEDLGWDGLTKTGSYIKEFHSLAGK